MLQIKDVTKEYRMHDVYVVKALDHVSVTFPEKGMVFLIGKSGSGKSTLLNISGGLDMPDSGEIILKGRSSKDFTPSDFDCYRNTFVGFIFQEYNVLDEFTVEDNIAIALELQGKAKDEKAIEELLKEVDLEGLGKRRPNTLSGGQKQRVAIARALVKNPEIIMADEPTGALDSATGKQVFDTLKKLSEKKLVLVVSHDREFAETYGDRIIELKDGKIISDKSKAETREGAEENLSFIGEKTLSVRAGSRLTDEEIGKIVSFLKSNEEDLLITADQKEVRGLQKAAGIAPDGVTSGFTDTDTAKVDQKQYDGSKVSFIKSKLPFRHAVKLGTSSLRIKPFKLAFTALLATVAFIVFGMLSTLLTYSEKAVTINAMEEDGYSAIAITKSVSFDYVEVDDETRDIIEQQTYEGIEGSFTSDDIESFNRQYEGNAVGVFNYNSNGYDYSISSWIDGSVSYYFKNNLYVKGFCDLSDKNLADYGLELVAGTYPEGDTEIAISKYLYEAFEGRQITVNGGSDYVVVSSYEDLIGQTFFFIRNETDSLYLTITGIIDCGEIPSQYESLKEVFSLNRYSSNYNYDVRAMSSLADKFEDYYSNSFNSVFFVGSGFYQYNYSVCMQTTRNFVSRVRERLNLSYQMAAQIICDYTTYEELKDQEEAQTMFVITEYTEESDSIYQFIYYPFSQDKTGTKKAVSLRYEEYEDNEKLNVSLSVFDAVDEATDIVGIMRTIFIAAGVSLALFAALLLCNFISVSIQHKEKEIGILRAVGARGSDVFKIFICEALVITLICFVLASVGTAIVCAVVNSYMLTQGVVDISIFLFGVVNVFTIFLIALLTAVAATYFPVRKAVKKKPVEVIRAI